MLKRMLSLIMAIAVMLTVIVVSEAPVMAASTLEPIYTSDLEADAEDYLSYNGAAVSGMSVETNTVHSGSTAVKKTKASEWDYARLAGATNQLEMGETYKISFWINVISGPSESYTVSLVPSVDYSTKWGFLTAKSGVAPGEWVKVEYDFTLNQPWNEAVCMDVQVGGSNTVYAIDDVEIYKIVLDPSVVYSTDLESGATSHIICSAGGGVSVENSITHSGSTAVRYKKTTEYMYACINGFKDQMEVGKNYGISFWLYVVSGTTGSGTYTCSMVPGLSSFSTAKSGIRAGEWVQVEYNYTCTAPLNYGLMGITVGGSDIIYILDDIEIRELPLYETSFETDFSKDIDNAYGGASQSSTQAHSGTYSMKNVKTAESLFVRLTGFNKKMVNGKAYRFTMWVYVESGSQDTYTFSLIPVSDWSHYRSYVPVKDDIQEGSWVKIEYDFIFDPVNYGKPTPASMWTVDLDVSGTDTVYYIDDIAVAEVEPPTATVESIMGLNAGKDATGLKGITVVYSQSVTAESATTTTNYTINGDSSLIKNVDNISANKYFVEFTNILPEGFYLFGVNGVIDANSGETIPAYTTDFSCTQKLKIDFKVYKDYGLDSQYAIPDGALMSGPLTAVVEFGNYRSEAAAPMVVIALYEGDRLVSVQTDDDALGAYSDLEAPLTAEITVPAFDENTEYSVKAFLWDAADNSPYINEISLVEPEVVVLTVDPSSSEGSTFSSPYLANESIDDNGPLKQYIIDIAPGVYTEVNWTVKNYVTLRGQDKDTCILRGKLPENADPANIEAYSTINMYGTASLENLTITAQNLRYPVHDEGAGSNRNAYRTVKNCVIEHLGNDEAINYWAEADSSKFVWPYISPWGYGSASGILAVFDDTEFKSVMRGWYVHNNKDFDLPQRNILRNCTTSETGNGVAVQVENLGSGTNDTVVLENCKFGGQYVSFSDAPYITEDPELQTASHINYSVKVEDCDPLGFTSSNRGRALRITSNSTDSTSSVSASGTAADCLLGDYTAKNGGGGAQGYLYGYWDISGIMVGMYSDEAVDNSLGKRLGDCSGAGKKLILTFDNNETVEVVFNRNYLTATNAVVLGEINAAIEGYGVASEYDVDGNEYYPEFVGKEYTAANNTAVAIERFSPVCLNNDGSVSLMTSPSDKFAGIALERIVPGESGRVLKEGYLNAKQMGVDVVEENAVFTVDSNGKFVATAGDGILVCDNDNGWALFRVLD